MDAFQAIVLGIVQGLTEYLPVSSTAHLRIVPAFVGWEDPGAAFTAVTQLGTMAAVLLYFRPDLWRIARTWLASLRRPELRSELDARMGWYIILGTIPIGHLRPDLLEPDRERRAQPVPDRDDADPARLRCCSTPSTSAAATATWRRSSGATGS